MEIYSDNNETGFILQKIIQKIHKNGIEFKMENSLVKNNLEFVKNNNNKFISSSEKIIINIEEIESNIGLLEKELDYLSDPINTEKINFLLDLYTKVNIYK